MKTKKVLSVCLGLLLFVAFGQATAHTEADPCTTDLIAGQHINVGDVNVWNDGDNLYVQYVTTGDWELVETHLDVNTSPAGINQTKKGNPIPGQFDYSMEHDPPVTTYTYTIPLTWAPGTMLAIAAHAVVVDMGDTMIMSAVSGEGGTMVTRRRAGNTMVFTSLNAAAVAAWEPDGSYPTDPTGDDPWDPSLWDDGLIPSGYKQVLTDAGADWIWESYLVQDPLYGTVITLQNIFDIDGYPVSGDLYITCDNAYEAFINETSVGSAQVFGNLETCALKQDCVDTTNWQSIEKWGVSGYLEGGENSLEIDAANEYFNPDDSSNSSPGTQASNPGGCIFVLEIEYAPQETAWGAGYDFRGKNWATYLKYTVQEEPD